MKNPTGRDNLWGFSALGGTRTPNLLIRSQMLYPLSYKREDKRLLFVVGAFRQLHQFT